MCLKWQTLKYKKIITNNNEKNIVSVASVVTFLPSFIFVKLTNEQQQSLLSKNT